MTECCCGNEGVRLLYSCSGGADVGALSDRIARRLAKEGFGKMSCLAGIGADISGFIASAKDAECNITIDGCPMRCAAKNFEKRGIKPLSFVLTEMGFEKGKTEVKNENIEAPLKILRKKLNKISIDTAEKKCNCC
ncbi:MAG: putative zinc-binding protein [Candidatus Cloacimonetes bacterium]|nr:putative zinc-binding protein [Candidatus Cloacimonadota bacterium]MBS3768416.1 putative zinc-binding protein [Candidatus Cloacimonadota bacterium]